MECKFCGTINPNDSEKCSFCGKPLSTDENVLNGNMENVAGESANEMIDTSSSSEDVNSVLTNNIQDISEPNIEGNLNKDLVSENDMVNNFTNTTKVNEDNNLTDTKKKKSKAPIIILIIIAVLLLFGVGIFLLMKSPKSIFTNTTKKFYNSVQKTLDTDYNTMYSSVLIKPFISSNQNMGGIDKIVNNVSLAFEGSMDYKNKKFIYNINAKYSEKELLNVDIQYDKDIYMMLNNIYKNPIKFDNTDMSDVFKKADNKNLKIILNGYIDALNNSVKSSYFKSKKEIIEINGKKVNAKASTLILTKTTADKMAKDISNSLQKNKEFIKAYKEMSDKSQSDALNSIKDIKVEDDFKPTNITIYTTGIKEDVVRMLAESDDFKLDIQTGKSDNNLIISVTSNGMTLKFDYTFNVKYNEKVKLKSVTNAVSYKDIMTKSSEIANKLLESDGFKALNNDFKNSTGFDLESIFSSSFNNSSLAPTNDSLELMTE